MILQKEVLRWFKRIVRFIPNALYRGWAAMSGLDMFEEGHSFLKQLRFSEAEAIFQKGIEKFPKRPHGYEGLASVAIQTWQREEGAKWLALSIEKTGALSSCRKMAGLLVLYAQYEEGFALMDELMKQHGAAKQDLMLKAKLLFLPKKYQEAAGILRELRQNFETRSLLARALLGAKQYEEANAVVDALHRRDTSNETDAAILRLLKCWQKYYLDGAGHDRPKIFGIGLSRTATTSLTTALNELGFNTVHFTNPLTLQVIGDWDFLHFDACCDSPVSYRFEELYELFPNARFIYTERNLKDWVLSNSNLYKPWGVSTTKEFRKWLDSTGGGKFDKMYHFFDPIYLKAYGSLYADFPDWESAYHAFDERVNRFFAGKPAGKLLKINICENPSWDELCRFLEVPVPDVPFPYSNTVVAREKARPLS